MLYKERLKELRERNNLKQKDLLNVINLSDTQFSNYENEIEIMPIKHIDTLCDYFDVSFDYIFSFTNVKQYSTSFRQIDKQEVGKRLKEFRKENKLTQVKLADILNIGNGTIADYERGRYLIATPFLYTICSKYKISADYLLGKVDSPKYLK
ncbi:MAG: helix-turn-helix domain-containing protein [Ruminococcus sp.]|nr:helix-turn-helix domain-containing protein [Ruminococcus sp.]